MNELNELRDQAYENSLIYKEKTKKIHDSKIKNRVFNDQIRFSSIFVSNIPWNASVQDLWDICNKWGVVIDVYVAAKRSKSDHRFGFVRFINVKDINQLVFQSKTAWIGWSSFIADVAKYGRTYNRPVERSGDGKPSVGSNSQSVSINENAVLGNKSVDMSGKYGTSYAEQNLWGVGLVTRSARIRDDSVLYNDGCIKDCMEKNLEDDAGEILGVHSQGDCGNVTTDE
ncbi:nucleotide-binding alpha-beta plait domain-containing protein [Tanacetum coccineum]|uniref:Nucleotide-binding alpha-beta plait domain-containing protein n=1 Tax=Tanacetum coccineum TaxID=301880 RepID=A0ABQ5HRL2_9ASTR